MERKMSISEFALPNTLETEHQLLSSVINHPERLYEVMRVVNENMFSTYENKKTWRVVLEMLSKGDTISNITIINRVDRKYFIDNLVTTNVGFLDTMEIASSLLDGYIKRQAYEVAVGILQSVESGENSEGILSKISSFKENVSAGIADTTTKDATEFAEEFADELEHNAGKVSTFIPTLNNLTYGGLEGGDLIILAARPSVGKTSIGMQLAQYASNGGIKTTFYSLEMTGKQLARRLILGTGLLSPRDIYSGSVDWNNFREAVSRGISPNLRINDKSKTLDEICTKITLDCQCGVCKFAIIDYLGLIPQRNKRISLAQHLGECTARLKGVAKDCGIPIVLLCQLNRDSSKEGRSPQLFDLRDSGAIEQDGDVIIMLERPRDESGTTIDNRIDMWVRKNRNGKCNFDMPIRLTGNDSYSNFYETA